MAELASRRCAELIQQLAGGEVLVGRGGCLSRAVRSPEILLLARRELWRVMGADVPDADVETILGSLGFAPQRADKMGCEFAGSGVAMHAAIVASGCDARN